MSAAAATTLDVARVRKTISRLREQLAQAVQLLGELYDGRAWVALGLPSWEALCAQELPELGQLLTVAERRSLVVDLRQRGMSLRAAAAPAGVSAATAKTWADDAGVQLATVTSLDGRIRPGQGVKQSVKPRPLVDVLVDLIAAHPEGLTVFDLVKRAKVRQSQASPALCRLVAAGRLTYRAPAKRGQTGTYLAG